MPTVKVIAPAKVNLFLGIGPAREDGFHGVDTVMHSLLLHDVVTVQTGLEVRDTWVPVDGMPDFYVRVTCEAHGGVEDLQIPAEKNIVYKAAVKLAQAFDMNPVETVWINIDKNIPHGGGLGGGSADAAATLVALCHIWNIDAQDERVWRVAGELGADVAFFLQGGCARMSGKGEILEANLTPARSCVLLVRPDAGVSTPQAYRTFDENPLAISEETLSAVKSATDAADVALYNNLAPAAEQLLPELGEVRAWLSEQDGILRNDEGEPQILLCGSGSTSFALCEDHDVACALSSEAKKKGWWSRVTSLSSVKAARLPK